MRTRIGATIALVLGLAVACKASPQSKVETASAEESPKKELVGMQIGYLEFVTTNVDEFCATYEKVHNVTFGDPIAELGNARITTLASGGKVGVRGPLRPDESPIVRPYFLTDDIETAFKAAEATGAELAHPPMKIPGHGTFAIFNHNGIESALWQN